MTISNDPDYIAWLASRPKLPPKVRGRPPKYIEHKGQRYTLREWSKVTGLAKTTIKQRLHIGWSVSDTLETKELINQYK